MSKNKLLHWISGCALSVSALAPCPALADHGLSMGTPDIQQAGPLAFGPDGILLVGDTQGAAIFAIDTGDTAAAAANAEINIAGINSKIAAMVGSTTEETVIKDMAVNPASGNIYFSVARGLGPDATALLFKADAKGEVSEVSLKDIAFAKASFENAPEDQPANRRNPRRDAITDLQYNDGKVIVAGLSNEEFASKLRVLDFPFDGKESATSIEVYHGAHGKLETNSPVRTFITYENTVLAAYTCTPLVTIPVEDLDGERTLGKTVAELGNRNQPLDMIIYKKGDQDYLLLSNSARGVMKMKLSMKEMDAIDAIKSRISGTAGLEYETLSQFENVVQLDKLGENHAVLLVSNGTGVDLKTIDLP